MGYFCRTDVGSAQRLSGLLVTAAIAIPQLQLGLSQVGVSPTSGSVVSGISVAVAVMVSIISGAWRPPRKVWPAVPLVALIIVIGFVVGLSNLPVVQVLQGMRIGVLPFLAAIVGQSLNTQEVLRMMRTLGLVLFASVLTALAQVTVGIAGLVDAGLEYGTSVRAFSEGRLRAPGLSLTNYDLGSFCGVFVALSILWWFRMEVSRAWRVWAAVSSLIGALGLFLSIYRTGFLLLFVAVGLWCVTQKGLRPGVIGALVITLGVLAIFLSKIGYLSTQSLSERRLIWKAIASQSVPFLGGGIGSAGAASGSSFSESRVVVDNYFLNLLVQFGVLGLVLILVTVIWAIRIVSRSRVSPRLTPGLVLSACIACFVFVEFWEYTSAMMLAMLVSASTQSEYVYFERERLVKF